MFIYFLACIFFCVSLSLCLSVRLCVCLSVCLCVCLSVRLCVCLSVCLPACVPVCLSAHLSVCLSICAFYCSYPSDYRRVRLESHPTQLCVALLNFSMLRLNAHLLHIDDICSLYSSLFHSTSFFLFYSISFYYSIVISFIPLYFITHCSILFYSALFCSILFYSLALWGNLSLASGEIICTLFILTICIICNIFVFFPLHSHLYYHLLLLFSIVFSSFIFHFHHFLFIFFFDHLCFFLC